MKNETTYTKGLLLNYSRMRGKKVTTEEGENALRCMMNCPDDELAFKRIGNLEGVQFNK